MPLLMERRWKRTVLLCFPLLTLTLFWQCSQYTCSRKHWFRSDATNSWRPTSQSCSKPLTGDHKTTRESRTFVVAAIQKEDHSWLDQFQPEWEKVVYVMDDLDISPSAPANKGHEAMAYLTYIIDNYDSLPEFMVFLHASRYQWHNEDPMYDGLSMIRRLQLDHVMKVGYTNLRCTWEIGCPAKVARYRATTITEAFLMPWNPRANADAAFPHAILELLPETALSPQGGSPEVAALCGAQFAVTAEQVHKRSFCHYEHLRDWLLATELPDSISGRIFERSWHMIFGMPPIDCGSTEQCFCEQYSLCNLTCTEGSCGRYKPPPKYHIPDGWLKWASS